MRLLHVRVRRIADSRKIRLKSSMSRKLMWPRPIGDLRLLFVDVFFSFQAFGESIQRALKLVWSGGGREFHFFYRGVKIALGASDTGSFIVGGPVGRVLLDIDAEDLKCLVLLALSLQQAAITM